MSFALPWGLGVAPAPGRGVAARTRAPEDAHIPAGPTMSDTPPPAPSRRDDPRSLSREEKMQLLHEELVKLNAQLEYLRLMLRLRARKA